MKWRADLPRVKMNPQKGALDRSPRHLGAGREVGLDFYDLLTEALKICAEDRVRSRILQQRNGRSR